MAPVSELPILRGKPSARTDLETRVLNSLIADQSVWAMTSVTINSLARWQDLPRRLIEEAVENLRLSGEPIIGDAHGLHLARNADELAGYVAAYDRRLRSMFQTRSGLRRTLRKMREREAHVEPLGLWGERQFTFAPASEWPEKLEWDGLYRCEEHPAGFHRTGDDVARCLRGAA